MLYKEWRHTRMKFGLMLAFYAFAGLLVNTLFAPKPYDSSGHSVFQYWVIGAIFVTIFAGVLGGVDAIAEENDKGTIGFLLARPVSRLKVYTVKIMLNSVALAVALAISSVVIFFTQLIDRFFTTHIWDDAKGAYIPVLVPDPFIGPHEAVSDIVAVVALGVMLVCLSTLVSVFTRSTIQAIIWTFLLILLGSWIIFSLINLLAGVGRVFINEAYMFRQFYEISLPVFAVLAVLAAAIYLLGLSLFRRKEF